MRLGPHAGGRVCGPAAGLAEDALDLRGALLIAFGDTAVNFELEQHLFELEIG